MVPLAAAWAVYRAPDRLHTQLVTEDGVLEWLQVAVLVVAAIALLARAFRATERLNRLALLGFAGMATFVGGEEMAWGSRLFDVGAAAIEGANRQGDLTLHNLHGGLTSSFIAVAIAGAAGGIYVARRRPALACWFLAPAVYGLGRVAYTGVITPRAAKTSEVLELVLYLAIARLAIRPPKPLPVAEAATTPGVKEFAIPG